MRVIKLDQFAIQEASKTIRNGGLVIFPSDTVYGALVDAQNNQAVETLIRFKSRSPGKPISVFVSDLTMGEQLVKITPEQKRKLLTILPGPFTCIFPSRHKTVLALESETHTLGIRFPNYNNVLSLVRSVNRPLTATSANLSGRSPHYSIESLLNSLPQHKKDLIDLIVDAGQLERNKPSTVINFEKDTVTLIREGDIVVKDKKTYISKTPSNTMQIAKHILSKNLYNTVDKPLIFILEGEMGSGKTVFVKGAAQTLGVTDIVSPSYVIYYEYNVNHIGGIKTLIHADMFAIEQDEEFNHLGLESYFKPNTVLFIEWGKKAGTLVAGLEKKYTVIYVKIHYR